MNEVIYWMSYVIASRKGLKFGTCDVRAKGPIKDNNDLLRITRMIEKQNDLEENDVSILNWKRWGA